MGGAAHNRFDRPIECHKTNRGDDVCDALKNKTSSLNIEKIQNKDKLSELKLKKRGYQQPTLSNNTTLRDIHNLNEPG